MLKETFNLAYLGLFPLGKSPSGKGIGIKMISVLLTILKIIGIVILSILGILIIALLLVLFVPIRYQVKARRKAEEEALINVQVKVTWLLHILKVIFSYPDAAYIRIKIFCFTIVNLSKEAVLKKQEKKQKKEGKKEEKKRRKEQKKKTKPGKTAADTKKPEKNDTDRAESIKAESTEAESTEAESTEAESTEAESPEAESPEAESPGAESPGDEPAKEKKGNEKAREKKKVNPLGEFFGKIWKLIINIRYTIRKLCDKIKHIVKNINYYLEIIRSDVFKRTWSACSGEAVLLIKSILPGKLKGNFVIGTGDPAGTGQVMAAFGILYPFIGEHIFITPDFENQILEGDFFMKGKITVFRLLKTAAKVYFNKDLRKVIELFKREAA